MEDDRIIALYNERNELAIVETSQKYGQYCGSIAVNILCDSQAAEECVRIRKDCGCSWAESRATLPSTDIAKVGRTSEAEVRQT